MEYDLRGGEPEAWYASFRVAGSSWRLDQVKGSDRKRLAAIVSDEEHEPRSGPRCTLGTSDDA